MEYIESSIIIPEYSPKYNELNKVIYQKENINVLQNIFSINKTMNKKLTHLTKLLLEKDIDIFEVLNKKMIEYKEKDSIILKQQSEINDLILTNDKIILKNKELNQKINKYENNKIIKFIKRIRNAIKRILKKL